MDDICILCMEYSSTFILCVIKNNKTKKSNHDRGILVGTRNSLPKNGAILTCEGDGGQGGWALSSPAADYFENRGEIGKNWRTIQGFLIVKLKGSGSRCGLQHASGKQVAFGHHLSVPERERVT